MKLDSTDLLRMRPAAARFVAFALVAAAAATAGRQLAATEAAAYERTSNERTELRQRLLRVEEDVSLVREFAERYRHLVASGRLGPERRLDWIERIDEVRRSRGLFDLRYDFAPQRPLEAQPFARNDFSDGFQFQASAMKLHMPLLHEQDLLVFLEDLADTVPAFLRVRECRLERLHSSEPASGLAALLQANCTIDWITLRAGPA